MAESQSRGFVELWVLYVVGEVLAQGAGEEADTVLGFVIHYWQQQGQDSCQRLKGNSFLEFLPLD